MRDDFLSTDWANSHKEMSNSFARLISTVKVALRALHRHQFSAPWKHTECDSRA